MRVLLVVILLLGSASAQELLRPTTEVDPGAQPQYGCAGTNSASSAMANSYDAAGLTTSSTQSVSARLATKYKNRLFSTWQSTGNTYTALTLNANASGSTATGTAVIKYSTNSGVTWTTLKSDTGGGFAQATFPATLSASQDLSKLRVSACIEASDDTGITTTDTITIWDIWTSGTISGSVPPGSGSTSGLAHRGVIFTF